MKRKKTFRKSYRKKRKVPFYKKRVFWSFSGFAFSILLLFYFSFFFNLFWVKELNILGNNDFPKEEIFEFINEKIETRVFFLSSKSIFWVNPSKILADLLTKYPELSGGTVSKNYPDVLTIEIYKRKAVATWCKEENDQCFYVDKKGIAFKEKDLSGKKLAVIKTDRDVDLGEEAVLPNEMKAVFDIWRGTKEYFIIKEFLFSDASITIKTQEGWEAYFILQDNLLEQIAKIKLVLDQGIDQRKRGELKYIDLRFDRRVYFK